MLEVRGHQAGPVPVVPDHQEDQARVVPDHPAVQVNQVVQVQQGHDEIIYLYIDIRSIHFRMLYNDKSPGS